MSDVNGRAADLDGGFDGLDGVGDELEQLGDQIGSGGRSGQPHSATPASADPELNKDNGEPAARGAEAPNLLQELGYESEEEALKGWRNLRNWTSQTKDEVTQLREENAALKNRMSSPEGPGAPRVSPAAQDAIRQAGGEDALEQLSKEYHIPRELLGPAVEQIADARLMAHLGPIIAATQVDQQMAKRYGQAYVDAKPRIEAFVASNPHVAQIVSTARAQGLPELANEYALGAYREALANATHQSIQRGAAGADDAVKKGRTIGAPIGSREHTRELMAQRQAGGEPVDFVEAITRANNGDDRMIDQFFARELPSEEHLEKVLRGHI